MHHSYLGGRLEHTVSVAEICDFMSGRYKYVNRDLLITAAILHDIAKIFELSPMPASAYTDDGQMLGHIYMGAELVSIECAKIPDFPHALQSLLKHAILAHHGEYEFGSPKLPSTIEAFILHAADNMDAKVKVYEEALAADTTPGPWVGFHKLLNRYLRSSEYEDA
jgi:3'-5' exoribonuclease